MSTCLSSKNERQDFETETLVVAGTLGAEFGRNRSLGNANETDFLIAEAIDVRNSRSNGDVSGTLQSKANGGYSLNYQNPIAIHAGSGEDISPALTSEGADSSEDGRGRHAFVAFNWNAGVKAGLSCGASEPTLRTGHHNHPAVSAPFGVRRLTPTECARLQGFPDDWAAYGADGKRLSDSAQYRMYGNAVAVPVTEWIGRRISVAQQGIVGRAPRERQEG